MADVFTFPDHDIDPRKKGFDWILQYCKAAWSVGSNTAYSAFYNNAIRYQEIREYALGKQSISKYRKSSEPDRQTDKSWENRDNTIVPVIPEFRNKALSKLLQRQFDINAFAIDEQAQTDQDKMINEWRVKIAMRDMLQKAGSPIAATSGLQRKSNAEPQDNEQLELLLQFGWKHNICMDAEMAVDFLFNYNQFDRERKIAVENEYDIGAGGYRIYMDENGKPRFRSVDPENLIVDYCEKPDFSDAGFVGETIYVNVSDLVPFFTPEQVKVICKSVAGKYNNPRTIDYNINRYYNKFKVLVCDIQFISWNTAVFENTKDKYGNQRFPKTDFKNLDKINKGESDPVYMYHTKKVIYEAKWIVDTDFMYDYGLAKNQVRKGSSWWDTQFDFVLEAWNFNRMKFAGITEGLIPLADDYYETRQKLQNLKRKLIPYMIALDLDTLEEIDFGKGGEAFTPAQVIDLLVTSNILVYRGKSLITNNQIGKPAQVEVTGMLNELVGLRNELVSIKQEMMEMSGYNAATLGNPNPKLLNAGYNLASSATNDSLWRISEADRKLTLRLADMLVQKTQIAVKLGKVDGFSRALGNNSVKMFQLSPDISLHEFAIFLEDAATPEQRQELIMQMNEYDQKGLLEPQDRIMIEYCRNLKYAQMLLSFLVSKRKQEAQANALQMQQANTQTQIQSAQAAEQAKQQTLIMAHQAKMEELNAEGRWMYETAALKTEGGKSEAQISAQAKIIQQQIIEDNKGKMQRADHAQQSKESSLSRMTETDSAIYSRKHTYHNSQ